MVNGCCKSDGRGSGGWMRKGVEGEENGGQW